MNSTFCEFIVKEFEKKDSVWYFFILFALSFSIANREGLRVQRFEGSTVAGAKSKFKLKSSPNGEGFFPINRMEQYKVIHRYIGNNP